MYYNQNNSTLNDVFIRIKILTLEQLCDIYNCINQYKIEYEVYNTRREIMVT